MSLTFDFNIKTRLLISGALFALGVFIILFIQIGLLWKADLQPVRAAASDNICGWGWSEGIGWISMNCYNDYAQCPASLNGGLYWSGRSDACCPIAGVDECTTANAVAKDGQFEAYHENIWTKDIAGYWKMNEASWPGNENEVVDSSGNANHGRSYGDANTSSTNVCRNIGTFDGSGDYIEVSDASSLDLTSALTIEAWIYVEDVSNRRQIVSKWGDPASEGLRSYAFLIETDRQFSVFLAKSTTQEDSLTTQDATDRVSLNTWTHLAATFNSSTINLYKNGELVETKSAAIDTLQSTTSNLRIGIHNEDIYPFKGKLDNVAIYSRAKTQAELAAQATNTTVPASYGINYGSNKITGWAWGEGAGWICFGETCQNVCLGGANNGQSCTSSVQCDYPNGVCGGKPPHGWPKSWACVGKRTWACAEDPGQSCINSDTCTCVFSCSGDSGEDFVSTGPCSYSDLDPENHLRAHWKMNSISSGTINDGTGTPEWIPGDNEDNGTLNPVAYPPTQVKGKHDDALKFDGADDYVEVGDSADLSVESNLTIEVWVKRRGKCVDGDNPGAICVSDDDCVNGTCTVSGEQTIIGKWDESANKKSYRLWFDTNNKLNFAVSDGTTIATITQKNGICLGAGRKLCDGIGETCSANSECASGVCMHPLCASDDNCNPGEVTGEVCKNAPVIDTGKWHHITGKYIADIVETSDDETAMQIFIDGTFVDGGIDGTIPSSLTNKSQNLYIGAKKGSSVIDTFFNGLIDNVSVWSCQNVGNIHGRYTKEIWDDSHMELDGWARIINLGNGGWLKLKGFTKDGRVWGSFLGDYGAFYTFGGYLANRYVDTSMDDTGLVGHWRMDEPDWTGSNNSAADSSPENNNGTVYGAGVISSGIFNSAGDFDGVDDYIEISDDSTLDMSDDITIAAWVRPEFTLQNKRILTKGQGTGGYYAYSITARESGKFKTWVRGIDNIYHYVEGATSYEADHWYYVVMTYDGSDLKLYVDGQIDAAPVDVSTNIINTDGALFIGKYDSGSGEHWKGRIDHVTVYSQAKSDSEILNDYNKSTPYCAGWGDYDEEGDPPEPLEFNTLTVDNSQGCEQLLVTWDSSDWAENYTYWRNQENTEADCGTCSNEANCAAQGYTENSVLEGEECYLQDTDVQSNTGYCYVIVAHNETGSTWITDSQPTYPSPYWKSTTLCSPTSVSVDDTVCGEITVSWTKSADADGYNIYRDLTETGSSSCDDLTNNGCELIGHLAEGLDYDADNDATNDLVAQWKMNEVFWDGSNKEVKDSSAQTPLNDGTAGCEGVDCVVPSTTETNALFDRAGDFGGDDYVEVQSKINIEITDDITIEAWVKGSINGVTQGIVSKAKYDGGGANRQGWMLYKYSSDEFAFRPFINGVGTVIYSNDTYTDTNWHHLAVIRDSGTFYFYVDGVKQTDTTTDGFTESNDSLVIGRTFADYDGEYFTGLIDNVAIYNVAKTTAEQIKIDYEAGTNPNCVSEQCGLTYVCGETACGTADTCCFTDSRIIPYVNYYYRVTAVGEAGESPSSGVTDPGQTICFPAAEEQEE